MLEVLISPHTHTHTLSHWRLRVWSCELQLQHGPRWLGRYKLSEESHADLEKLWFKCQEVCENPRYTGHAASRDIMQILANLISNMWSKWTQNYPELLKIATWASSSPICLLVCLQLIIWITIVHSFSWKCHPAESPRDVWKSGYYSMHSWLQGILTVV